MRTSLRLFLSACLFVTITDPASAQLEITIDTNGSGSATFADTDADGVVDFDTTVGAVLEAQGQVKQVVEAITTRLAIAPLPPSSNAVFRNVSSAQQTITVTVKSATLPAPVAAPLGWDLFYNGAVDDPVDSIVDVPSHSLQALAGGGSISLGTLTGAPLTVASLFSLEARGVDPTNISSDAWIVWTFTLGPNDEFLVPSDGGFDGESIQVNVFNQSQKCTDKMNNGARKVLDVAQKADTKCVKTSAGVATACVDATDDAKTAKKQGELAANFETWCDPVPAWGVNGLSCCSGGGTNDGDVCSDSSTCSGGQCVPGGCVAEVAEAGANDMTHDLFGPAVTVSADKRTAVCQRAVSQATARLLVEHWKAFRICKRDAFSSITDDADLVSMCLQPEPDPKTKIAKRETQLSNSIQTKCLDKGISGLGVQFPGACSTQGDGSFSQCLAERARCRLCLAVNSADAIVPPLDCDVFDDALSNASCAP